MGIFSTPINVVVMEMHWGIARLPFFYVFFVTAHKTIQITNPARIAITGIRGLLKGNKIGKITGSTAAPILLTET